MSEATTAAGSWAVDPGSNSGTIKVNFTPKPKRVPRKASADSIRCEVLEDGSLALIPLDALGAYYLMQFGHGSLKPSWESVMLGDDDVPWTEDRFSVERGRRELVRVVVRTKANPMLTKSGDPFYTGMGLSDAEQQACRALVDRMRGAARKPAKRARAKKSRRPA